MITADSPLFLPMVIGTAIFAIGVIMNVGGAVYEWVYRHQLVAFATHEDHNGRHGKAGQARCAAAEAKQRATNDLHIALLLTATLAVAWLIPWDIIAGGTI